MVRSTTTAAGLEDIRMATQMAINDYANLGLTSQEQLYCPVQIMKNKWDYSPFLPYFEPNLDLDAGGRFGQGGCVGPTNDELDPYFSTVFGDDGTTFFREVDYQVVVNEDSSGTSENLHIDKLQHRDVVQAVRTISHRTPMILTGWGFDLGDRPVPRAGTSFPEVFQFDRQAATNRARWKTGPLAVQWDDERQVWSGGPQIVCGIALEEIKAPKTPCKPTQFAVQLFRKSSDQFLNEEDKPVDLTTELDRGTDGGDERDRIVVQNRDPSLEQDFVENAMFVIAIRLNYEWLPLWVGCPEDEIEDIKVPCIKG